eukprot:4110576-Alexandrium_andersonii.AAC.1
MQPQSPPEGGAIAPPAGGRCSRTARRKAMQPHRPTESDATAPSAGGQCRHTARRRGNVPAPTPMQKSVVAAGCEWQPCKFTAPAKPQTATNERKLQPKWQN